MFLTNEEVKELTSKSQRASQTKVLNALGITYKIRPDGSLIVLRAHVERLLGGRESQTKEEREAKQEAAWQVEFEASLEAMRLEGEERARKRKAQQDAKKEQTNQKRASRGLPPLA